MTRWERICKNLGLDPVLAEPAALKSLGPDGYTGDVETTCQRCGLEMEGQFKRCIGCGGDWTISVNGGRS
jgi:hypothetical protein